MFRFPKRHRPAPFVSGGGQVLLDFQFLIGGKFYDDRPIHSYDRTTYWNLNPVRLTTVCLRGSSVGQKDSD